MRRKGSKERRKEGRRGLRRSVGSKEGESEEGKEEEGEGVRSGGSEEEEGE